jgi:hypothetical protein
MNAEQNQATTLSERSERIIRLSVGVPHGGTERSGVLA